MAEKEGAMTPTRHEQRAGRNWPSAWDRSPFNAMQRFADDMDRLFDDFGLGRGLRLSPRWSSPGAEGWAPDIDVYQKNDQLIIKADLPGLAQEDVSVNITDRVVSIQGERRTEREEEREGFYRSERSHGSFCREISLPEGAITDQAKATFRNGVLEITMPSPPAMRGRRLEITGEGKK
jgi:HSP20 family protein